MIDWSRVEELRDEIGTEDFADVVALFLDETDAAVAALEPGSAAIGEALHFLRGSALNLGFRSVASLCQAGEKLAASGAAGQIDFHAIQTGYHQSRAEFLARLPQMPDQIRNSASASSPVISR